MQYTTTQQATHRITGESQDAMEHSLDRQGESSHVALLEVIQGSMVVLEGQIAGLMVEVNMLSAGLHEMVDKVGSAETNIATLQRDVHFPKTQVTHLPKITATLEERAKDAKGTLHRNKLHLLGFPERAKAE
ncbi:hypothetical protein NDU88_008493 [Pleurodeles waltl]|uniref:Uncharacterized protein n=1 Tax=Pleurodeles waltl TaxID=8319 RepID=A0AAV7N550_PLEWA|nr:hypothetical protein NDU88_008493 [Pleurodeles waltl]